MSHFSLREMKRNLSACDDADYDVTPDPDAQQSKRQKLLESDGKSHISLFAVLHCVNVACCVFCTTN